MNQGLLFGLRSRTTALQIYKGDLISVLKIKLREELESGRCSRSPNPGQWVAAVVAVSLLPGNSHTLKAILQGL